MRYATLLTRFLTSPATRCWCLAAWLLGSLAGAAPARAQTMLQASGPRIVNAGGQEVILNGMNLGGWMLQEGYMMKPGFGGTQGNIKRQLYFAGLTDAQVEAFYQGWRDNFVMKADIDYLAAKGFNCVRLPLHYELFLTARQRAVRTGVSNNTVAYTAYVDSLAKWYNNNQLFTDLSALEGVRLVNETLSWCGGNGMYVVLDLHAAPGAQGTDTNISDALLTGGNDFWNTVLNQDIANLLWSRLATRYKNDPRIAMYDVLNEPNGIPTANFQNGNQRLHDVMQRFINTIRATGDNHLILLEGNGYGNDYNWMEKFTFPTATNLVYSSHRYSGATYPLDNNVTSTESNINGLRFIGNLTRFRSTNNVPIWVGETGENTSTWMNQAAIGLGTVGIGYCHWTYKRFENGPNAALLHINPPYLVDGGATNIPAVLQNIRLANNVENPATLNAVAPTPTGTPRPADPPYGRVITLKSLSTGNYLSGENGTQPMSTTHATAGASEQFGVFSAGNNKVYLRSQGKYVSSENGTQPMTCNRTTVGYWEAFDWIINADSTITLGGFNGSYAASGTGSAPVSCTQTLVSAAASFRLSKVGVVSLGARASAAPAGTAYPNPVAERLTYALPAGTRAHQLTLTDATGRLVLSRSYGDTGAQNTLDTSGLAPGLYVVRLTGAGFAQVLKVSKE